MPRSEHLADLYHWQTAEAFRTAADAEGNRLQTAMVTGHHSNVREAFVAARFAPLAYPGRLIRLVANDPPDFELGPAPVVGFEVAEALEPGRRRGDEYRTDAPGYQLLGDERLHPDNTVKVVKASLGAIALKKAAKAYDPATRLVVYLNITTAFTAEGRVLDAARDALRPAAIRFVEIWLYWKGAVFRIHPERLSQA